MKTLEKYRNCKGCKYEIEECYKWQTEGFAAGFDWVEGHCFHFVLNKKGEFIIE